MAMAIITADIVHTLTIGLVCLYQLLVELFNPFPWNVELDIFMSLTKGKIVKTNIIGPSKVMDDSF